MSKFSSDVVDSPGIFLEVLTTDEFKARVFVHVDPLGSEFLIERICHDDTFLEAVTDLVSQSILTVDEVDFDISSLEFVDLEPITKHSLKAVGPEVLFHSHNYIVMIKLFVSL